VLWHSNKSLKLIKCTVAEPTIPQAIMEILGAALQLEVGLSTVTV
jgi:hypothetical protein